MLKPYLLLSILLGLCACGAESKPISEQYLQAISMGDITEAKELFCGLTDDLRIMELTSADSWEVVSESPQVFGGIETVRVEVNVNSKIRGDD